MCELRSTVGLCELRSTVGLCELRSTVGLCELRSTVGFRTLSERHRQPRRTRTREAHPRGDTGQVDAASPGDDGFAARVVRAHGGHADAVVELSGNVNRVFRVSGADTDWVVRYPLDDRCSDEFPTEVWAAPEDVKAVETVGVQAVCMRASLLG